MGEPNAIFNVVLGTAGHIDHGKSTLVQALTGIHPDRLKEEQERGITIDLGFAPLTLRNGLRVGIVDVPGHERFVKNMVAGATGIDFVMLVVAADDGVMAQTREHLQIIQLLGVRDGLTVVTKTDLVEPDYVELAIDDVRSLLTGTVLADKPILPVSARTGTGLNELKTVLEERLARLARRASTGPFRMPIQRVFAKEGFGLVVTGIPISGQTVAGDIRQVLPIGKSGRVKGLHAYGAPITVAQAGHSTALNLHTADLDKTQVVRGMVVATPEIFRPTRLVTAQLQHLSGAPWPLKHRAPVRFHTGTAEIQGKVLPLGGDVLPAGTTGWVQILLEEPTVCVPGDRYILRHQSPVVTLGGGIIVDNVQAKRKRRQTEVLSELDARLTALQQPAELLAHILAASEHPKALADLCAEVGLLPDDALQLLSKLERAKRVAAVRANAVFSSPPRLQLILAAIVGAVEGFLKEHPALGVIELPELRRRATQALGRETSCWLDDLLALLKQQNRLKLEANTVAVPSRERKLTGDLAVKAQAIEERFKAGALTPPALAEVESASGVTGKTFKEIFRFLVETGALVEAPGPIYFHRAPYEQARAALLALFKERPELTMSEIRQHLGMNRKFVVPLMELFDQRKVTVREGDKRRLLTP